MAGLSDPRNPRRARAQAFASPVPASRSWYSALGTKPSALETRLVRLNIADHLDEFHDLVLVEPDGTQRLEVGLGHLGRVQRELLGIRSHGRLALTEVGLTPVDGHEVRRACILTEGAQGLAVADDAVGATVDPRDDHPEQLAVGVTEVALLVDEEVEVAPPREELLPVDGLRAEDVGHEAERLLRLVPQARRRPREGRSGPESGGTRCVSGLPCRHPTAGSPDTATRAPSRTGRRPLNCTSVETRGFEPLTPALQRRCSTS